MEEFESIFEKRHATRNTIFSHNDIYTYRFQQEKFIFKKKRVETCREKLQFFFKYYVTREVSRRERVFLETQTRETHIYYVTHI